MRSHGFHARTRIIHVAPLLIAAACASHAGGGGGGGGGVSTTPLQCAGGSGQSATAEIGEAGGTVSVRGHSLTVPPGALNGRTPFTITEWESGYVGVEVGPHGTQFARNATLTLSYARCPGSYRDLTIVYVREQGKEVVQALPTTVNPQARTVTTQGLQHLSGYLIGGNRTEGS